MDSNAQDPNALAAAQLPDGSLPWTEETVWQLVSAVMDMPETADDISLYWHNASQGAALLMAGVYILAKELHDMDDGESRPALVRKIVSMAMNRSEDIKELIVKTLL